MKKTLLISFLAIIFLTPVKAQTFSITPGDTLVGSMVLNDLGVFDIFQNNLTNDSLYLSWKKISTDIPTGWDYSLCDYGACQIGIPDSGSMEPVIVGQHGFLGINLAPYDISGTALIRMAVWDSMASNNIDTLTWIISTRGGTSGITDVDKDHLTVFPNPTTEKIYVKNSSIGRLTVYSVIGQIVLTKELNSANESVDVTELPSGTYWIECTDSSGKKEVTRFEKL